MDALSAPEELAPPVQADAPPVENRVIQPEIPAGGGEVNLPAEIQNNDLAAALRQLQMLQQFEATKAAPAVAQLPQANKLRSINHIQGEGNFLSKIIEWIKSIFSSFFAKKVYE